MRMGPSLAPLGIPPVWVQVAICNLFITLKLVKGSSTRLAEPSLKCQVMLPVLLVVPA